MSDEPVLRSFPPVADRDCRTLILGTMPGARSLERGQYYGHPRNAFWPIMASLLGIAPDAGYPERCRALLAHRIALWDVVARCRRPGSADADIRDARPNDIAGLLRDCPAIDRIFFNGGAAGQLFKRLTAPCLAGSAALIPAVRLPSTSPAHVLPFKDKLAAWSVILPDPPGKV